MLIDGHRENDDIYDGSDLGNILPVGLDLIDRVEVIHGPSSSIYGSSAYFAKRPFTLPKGWGETGMSWPNLENHPLRRLKR